MFKYILVPAKGAESDAPVFQTALVIARQHLAHLAFLHVGLDVERVSIPVASSEFGGGAGIAEIIESLKQEVATWRDKAREAVDGFCMREGIPMSAAPLQAEVSAEWLAETGDEGHWLATHGRVADLLVLGRPRASGAISLEAVDLALMDTGRPTLIAPSRPPEHIGRIVAIAWKDTAEAAAAVAASMPLLRLAQQVVIVSVNEDAKTDAHACERLRRALLWQNLPVTVRCVPLEDAGPADRLLGVCADLGADLLVMAAYGHNRMRAVVYGGVTRRILQAADLPVLMAH